MNTLEARKIKLAQELFELNNELFIAFLEELFQQQREDEEGNRWIPSEEEIQGIKDAMKQVENGEYVSEEEVRERYKKWLK
jgi:hypothetical protein